MEPIKSFFKASVTLHYNRRDDSQKQKLYFIEPFHKLLKKWNVVNTAPGACTKKHCQYVIYGLYSKLVFLFVQASVFVLARIH